MAEESTNSWDDYLTALRGDLLDAARHQASERPSPERIEPRARPLADASAPPANQNPSRERMETRTRVLVAAAVLVVTVLAVNLVRTPASSAEVFRVTETATEITFDVVNLVDDPAEVSDQLTAVLGVPATTVAAPVADHLVGRLTVTEFEDIDTSQTTVDADGTITQIVIERDAIPTSVEVVYGRPALDNEPFAATSPDPRCVDVFGLTLNDAQPFLDEIATTVTFATFSANADNDSPDPELVVVQILFVDNSTLVVTLAPSTDDVNPHPNCAPS